MQRQMSNPNLLFQSLTDEQITQRDERLNKQYLEARDAGIEKLEDDVRYVNGMFKDLHALVVDQGVDVHTIADNIEKARSDTKKGLKEIQSASASQRNRCAIL